MSVTLSEDEIKLLEFLALATDEEIVEHFGEDPSEEKLLEAAQAVKYVGAHTVHGATRGAQLGAAIGSLVGGTAGMAFGAVGGAGYSAAKLAKYKIQQIHLRRMRNNKPDELEFDDDDLNEAQRQYTLLVARALS